MLSVYPYVGEELSQIVHGVIDCATSQAQFVLGKKVSINRPEDSHEPMLWL